MSGEAAPLVSVLVPTFNRRDYLRATLKSALAQSLGDFEIIVHDNASAIDPADIVQSFGDGRIRYYRHAANLGITANILAAASHARGKYVAILGDDDLWEPQFLASLVRPLETDSSLVLSFCDHGIIGSDGRPDPATADKVTRRFGRHRLKEGVYRPFDEIATVYRSICVVSGAVLRQAAIDWTAMPASMGFGADLYLAYLAARTGQGCYYLPQRLAQYRYHPNSAGSSLREPRQRLANARDAMFYWGEMLRDTALRRNKGYFEMKLGLNAMVAAASLMRSGDWRGALQELRRSLTQGLIRPRLFLYLVHYAFRLGRATA